MQKSPKTPSEYAYSYTPLELPEEFPLEVSPLFTQSDRPITYLHSHNVTELGLCLKGGGVFVVGEKVLPFQEGDVILVTKRETHLAQSSSGTDSEWIWIYFDLERLLLPRFNNLALVDASRLCGRHFPNIPERSKFPRLRGQVEELVETWRDGGEFRRERAAALLCLVVAAFQELAAALPPPAATEPQMDAAPLERLQKALVHMARHYARQLSVAELAKVCGMSPTNFKRLFREGVGHSPIAFLNRLRITAAFIELERGAKPIGQIALDSGFATLSSFNRQFKRQTGMSPRRWRSSRP